jgi:hypothetical protein
MNPIQITLFIYPVSGSAINPLINADILNVQLQRGISPECVFH